MSLPSVSECARSETDEQPDFEEIENKSDFPGCLLDCDSDVPVSSNVGAHNLPFQRWMKFKEAFSPRFVANAVESLGYRPLHCIDPFGGSGTTALTCSFYKAGR